MFRAIRSILALRPLAFSTIAGVIALGLFGVFGLTLSTSDASHTGAMDVMSIDMDVTGNSATALGPWDECVAVSAGDDVVIDVTAANIPESTAAIAFTFQLIYGPANLSITANDNEFLLASLAGSTLFDTSDLLPDSDGAYTSSALDIGVGDVHESGSGVLSRITIDTSGATPGVYPLTLVDPGHIDLTNTLRLPDNVQNAFLAVDETCDNLPTPSPTPSPTPTPTPPPPATATPTPSTEQTAVGIDHDGGTPDINQGPRNVPVAASDSVRVVGSSPSNGLGAWEIDITYDSTIISVDSCDAAAIGLNLCAVDAVAPETIRVVGASAGGIHDDNIVFATINFTAVGTDGDCTDLSITVNQYADVNAQETDSSVTDGEICIGQTGSPTPIPSPFPSPTPGSPPNEPAGGCPPGDDWHLAPITDASDELDNGNFSDQNGDGFGCYRVNKGQTAKHDGIPSWTWKDNTNPLP